MELVKTFGIGKWAEIARHMQGRTDQQCMGRWRRHLDPNIRRVRHGARARWAAQRGGTVVWDPNCCPLLLGDWRAIGLASQSSDATAAVRALHDAKALCQPT
jgi:hypothetical protein